MRISFLMLWVLTGAALFAADVAGKWTATGRMCGAQLITLKVTGGKITGTLDGGKCGVAPIVDGKVVGDKVTFTVHHEEGDQQSGGKPFDNVFEGTVSGDELPVTISRANSDQKGQMLWKRAAGN